MFHPISLETWPRAETYRHFMEEVPCTYSICVSLDISRFLPAVRENGLRFFPFFLYGLSLAVNEHREFRMRLDAEGKLGYFDTVDPCYTVFHPEQEGFSTVWTEFEPDFDAFYRLYLADMEVYGGRTASKPMGDGNTFDVSCIPWTSFTGFNLNLPKGYGYFAPIFTVGKYFEEAEKIKLPLAAQVHHAVCDGFHVSRLLNELQEWLDHFQN